MGRWARSRPRPSPPSPYATLLNLLLALSAAVYVIASVCDTGLQDCLDLYDRAQEDLEENLSGQSSGLSPEQSKCVALRTLNTCISNMSRSHCAGNLNYHSFKKGVRNQMTQFNCSPNGNIYIPSASRPLASPTPSAMCSYRGPKVYKLCQLFGDPHLRTFDDRLETCRLEGAWPLLDNDHLIVQVTNDAVGATSGDLRPTAITKVTVMIKHNRRNEGCGPNEFVTLQASSEGLPGKFDDGTTSLGPEHSVRLIESDPGKHVEIYLSYIDTTIIIRKNGRFFSTSIRMPEDVANATNLHAPHSHSRRTPHKLQLCTKGCPKVEFINYKKLLLQKHNRLKSGAEGVNKMTSAMTVDMALSLCRREHLVDWYLDSCVFDLMATANVNFTKDASLVFTDMLKLYPNGAKLLSNRTTLPPTDSSDCCRTRPYTVWFLALGVLLYLTHWSSNSVL